MFNNKRLDHLIAITSGIKKFLEEKNAHKERLSKAILNMAYDLEQIEDTIKTMQIDTKGIKDKIFLMKLNPDTSS